MKYQISKENWESSRDKIKGIVKKVEDKIKFDDSNGWYDLSVVCQCGYCKEFSGCTNCALKKRNLCYELKRTKASIFWQFVEEMRNDGIYHSILRDKKYVREV
jgi:hypothetical protein